MGSEEHIIVYMVKKKGFDPIQQCKLTGDFHRARLLVKRPLGWSVNTTDLQIQDLIERFFAANMTVSQLAAMIEAATETSHSLEAEVEHALERLELLQRSLQRRLDRIRERNGASTPSVLTRETSDGEHERDEMSHQPGDGLEAS